MISGLRDVRLEESLLLVRAIDSTARTPRRRSLGCSYRLDRAPLPSGRRGETEWGIQVTEPGSSPPRKPAAKKTSAKKSAATKTAATKTAATKTAATKTAATKTAATKTAATKTAATKTAATKTAATKTAATKTRGDQDRPGGPRPRRRQRGRRAGVSALSENSPARPRCRSSSTTPVHGQGRLSTTPRHSSGWPTRPTAVEPTGVAHSPR